MRNICILGFLLACWLCCSNAMATESVILFAASADSALPLAEIQDNVLTAGILMELGDAIAHKINREARYLTVPRNRLDKVLTNGTVDGICYVMPGWVSAPVNWSRSVIRNENLLVGGAHIAAPRALKDLANERLGVVLGYRYPELDAALGKGYVRDDSPTMPLNIKKLTVGRYRYAVVDRLSLEYQAKLTPELQMFSTFPISRFSAGCAFSKASKIPFSSIDLAIHELIRDGTIEHILARYR